MNLVPPGKVRGGDIVDCGDARPLVLCPASGDWRSPSPAGVPGNVSGEVLRGNWQVDVNIDGSGVTLLNGMKMLAGYMGPGRLRSMWMLDVDGWECA
jgi:hypothetical protein